MKRRGFCFRAGRAGAGRRGQTLLFLLMLLVVLTFFALLVFDVHKTLFVKTRAQNAGDAAALAGARWQAIALNLIGELNVLQAIALTDALARDETVFPEADAIADLAARLNFAGPLVGLAAAQEAAKQNRAFVNPAATARLTSHGRQVALHYPNWFPAPFGSASDPGEAWGEYAAMILAVAAGGIAAEPVYPGFGYLSLIPGQGHLLLRPAFYFAVLGRSWCWFHFHAMHELRTYQSWTDWPPLPLRRSDPINSEFLSLRLRRYRPLNRIPGLTTTDQADLLAEMEQAARRGLNPRIVEVASSWHGYHPAYWGAWSALLPDEFPFESAIRSEYDVAGADAVFSIEEFVSRVTPGVAQPTVAWTAAAKPFGFLPGRERATRWGLVLPAFTDVRLIPVSAATSRAGGDTGIAWSDHVYSHLPEYLASGPDSLRGDCVYCRALRDAPMESGWWENAAFRAEGLEWLSINSQHCVEPGPGPGPGGGAIIGH